MRKMQQNKVVPWFFIIVYFVYDRPSITSGVAAVNSLDIYFSFSHHKTVL